MNVGNLCLREDEENILKYSGPPVEQLLALSEQAIRKTKRGKPPPNSNGFSAEKANEEVRESCMYYIGRARSRKSNFSFSLEDGGNRSSRWRDILLSQNKDMHQ